MESHPIPWFQSPPISHPFGDGKALNIPEPNLTSSWVFRAQNQMASCGLPMSSAILLACEALVPGVLSCWLQDERTSRNHMKSLHDWVGPDHEQETAHFPCQTKYGMACSWLFVATHLLWFQNLPWGLFSPSNPWQGDSVKVPSKSKKITSTAPSMAERSPRSG